LDTRYLGLVAFPEHDNDDKEFVLDLAFGADVLLLSLTLSVLGGFGLPDLKLLLGPLQLSSYDPLSPCTRNNDPLSALRSILTFWSIL
jgi:hypothetical protein